MATDFGRYLDHTLLRAAATEADVRRLCVEARDNSMATVCVFPSWIAPARKVLRGSPVKIATVIAFPFGNTLTEVKEAEMRAAAGLGAEEADIVIPISALKSGNDGAVESEMQFLIDRARSLGILTKFIIETAYLSRDEKVRVCEIANRVRPDFMKTSTGYAPSGATVEDVALMRSVLAPEIRIKASGGVRTYKDALAMIEAGASRLGTSSGVQIIKEARNACRT